MPQGKGTYGSEVGRPPKKKKYQDGGSIDPFSAKNPEGIIAEKAMEALEEQNSIPTANAMERSQVSPMGNEVGTGVYKEGGKVLEENRRIEQSLVPEDVDKAKIETLKKVGKSIGSAVFKNMLGIPGLMSAIELRKLKKKMEIEKAVKKGAKKGVKEGVARRSKK